MAKSKKPRPDAPLAIDPNSRATVSGPAEPKPLVDSSDDLTAKMAATQQLAAALPFNANKALEYDPEAAIRPEPGVSIEPADPIVGSSTVQEKNGSDKVGSGGPVIGENKTNGPLDRVRVDSSKRTLTTNQGVPVADNQNSLKAGLRGPTLLEDFILREKITHFDHERIPERIVHARGSAAHGVFQCTKALGELTKASLFAEVGKETPVFVRFSTVLGERGSTDTARDVRGFAVKFYTDEGNWDLVGNNIPVFFIQDAMKFPDLVHAAKPEPHFAMPQAGTAHDTFWDFASLMPEITHMLMWAMSDRAIPRSYRMMQGFGVHSFRLVNDAGESTFVKFHWNPVAGTHSLVWDEAVKISGADPDFHRRDLWEAIEAGAYPEWELALQIFTEAQAEAFSFDILDATKIVPEELVPLDAGRASGAQSQSRTTSSPRRSRWPSARRMSSPASIFRTIPCWRDAFIRTSTRRSRGWAVRTSTRSRSMRPWRRCTTTSAMACTGKPSTAVASPTSRTRWLGDVPFKPAPQDSSRSPTRWSPRPASCAASPSGLPSTTRRRACSSTVKRHPSARTSSTRFASSCRGCRPPRSGSGWCPA